MINAVMTKERTEPIGLRIKEIRNQKGMSQNKLALKSGIDRAYLSQIENGKVSSVTLRIAGMIAKALEIPVSFLVNNATDSEPSLDTLWAQFEKKFNALETVEVPVRGSISAGQPWVIRETTEEYTPVPREELGGARDVYALRVTGDSLIGDGINPGDLIIIEPNKDIVDGKIYAVKLDNEFAVRHLVRKADKLLLKASNGNYKDIEVAQADIIGRVILSGQWKRF